MQLRRGPPPAAVPQVNAPALRLAEAPRGPVRASQGLRAWRYFDGYSLRAVAGLLLVSVPVSIVLGVVMSTWSSQTSIVAAEARAEATAESAAVRINDFVAERRAQLRSVAQDEIAELGMPTVKAHLMEIFQAQSSFLSIQIFDVKGKVIASTEPGLNYTPMSSGSALAKTLSVETLGPVVIQGQH